MNECDDIRGCKIPAEVLLEKLLFVKGNRGGLSPSSSPGVLLLTPSITPPNPKETEPVRLAAPPL